MTNDNNNPLYEDAFHQPEPDEPLKNGADKISDAFLRVVMLIISLISLGIAMFSVAHVAIQFLVYHNQIMRDNIWPIILVIGLAYAVGWLVSLFGIRHFHNLVLPLIINIYAWATLAGVCILYIAILYRLYEQKYFMGSFAKYTIIMWVALAGLLGFHLLIEGHSLRPFSIPILIIALVHLYLIVFHYVFADGVNYDYVLGDVLFFLGMASASILMLVHAGVLSGTRRFIDRLFEKNPNGNGQEVRAEY